MKRQTSNDEIHVDSTSIFMLILQQVYTDHMVLHCTEKLYKKNKLYDVECKQIV